MPYLDSVPGAHILTIVGVFIDNIIDNIQSVDAGLNGLRKIQGI